MLMGKGSIFGKTLVNKPTQVRYEGGDINVSETVLEMLNGFDNMYFGITESFIIANHIGLKDSNMEILTEGFSDFIDNAIEFFKNLLEKFKKFISNIFMYISSFLRGFDKFLVEHKDKINAIDPDFSIYGFNYSFNSSTPNLDSIQSLVNSYNADVGDIHTKEKADILKEKNDNTSDAYFNKLRAQVLGESGEIDFEDFQSECKQAYRSGTDTSEEIHVNKSYLSSIVNDYPKLKQVYKDCQREKDKTITLIESIKTFFSRQAHVHPRNGSKSIYINKIEVNNARNSITHGDKSEIQYSTQSMEKVNIFFSYKWEQSKEIGSIVITAMCEKVNALKEAMRQTESTVRKALFNGKKPEEDTKND